MTQESELATAKAQLLQDFGKVVTDTEALLRSLAHEGGEKAVAMRAAVEANLVTAKARLKAISAATTEKATVAAKQADAYVHEHPWTAIGMAAAVGVIVGFLISNNRR